MVVVEVEVRRIVKKHFTNLAVKALLVDIDFETELLDRFSHVFPKLQEATFTREAIRLEQDLVLAVMDHVVGQVLSLVMLAYVLVHSLFSRAWGTSLRNRCRAEGTVLIGQHRAERITCGERRFRRAPGCAWAP